MTNRMRASLGQLRPLLAAVGAGLVAAALAGARVPAGPVGSPDWSVAVATVTVFRWAGVALAAYVAAVASVGLLARLRPGRLMRVTVAATPVVLRRLVFGSSVALAATAPLGALAAGATSASRPPPTMVLIERPPTSEPEQAPATPAPTASGTWTVRPGDHFWSITAAVLEAELGRSPGEREITGRWLALIEANRTRLVQPDDPDLLLPGQILLIPPP